MHCLRQHLHLGVVRKFGIEAKPRVSQRCGPAWGGSGGDAGSRYPVTPPMNPRALNPPLLTLPLVPLCKGPTKIATTSGKRELS